MSIKQSYFDEFNKFISKSIYDALTNATNIAQSAQNQYASLQAAFNNSVALSQELNNIQNQNINISTTFGNDGGGLSSKEFRFLYGSILKYDRVLPVTHPDTSEVVNLQTLLNILLGNNNTAGTLAGYLPNTGGTAVGSYNFNFDPAGAPSQAITLTGVALNLTGSASFSTPTGTLQTVTTTNPLSLVNIAYVDAIAPQTLGIAPQPTFISGKIALSSTQNSEIIQSFGKYNISAINYGSYSILKIKLLKFNTFASWDSSDSSWTALFGANPINSIPGSSLSSALNKIPYPVDYELYLEYNIDNINFPFAQTTTTKVRVPILNDYSMIIDADGDLTLILKTNYTFADPYYQTNILLDANGSLNPVLYALVKKWSYIPLTTDYINIIETEVPTLLFNNKTWMRDGTISTSITIRYRLTVANIPATSPITWTHNSTLTITFGSDSAGYYADIVFPIGETIYTIIFTASFTLGTAQTPTKQVNLQLLNYVYQPMNILPLEFDFNRWNQLPATLPITMDLLYTGGNGTVTWSVISDSDTTLASASINSTGVISGNYTTPRVDVYVKIVAQDSTYSITNSLITGTGTITTTGTTLLITGGTTTGINIGDFIEAASQSISVASITDSTHLVLASAFTSDLTTATSYNISKGLITTIGTTATLSQNITTSSISVGDYIHSGTESHRVQSITSSSVLILVDAFTVNLTNASYDIIKGQCIAKIKTHVLEFNSILNTGGVGVLSQ